MVRVSSPAKLRPWSELTAKMVMGVVPGLVSYGNLPVISGVSASTGDVRNIKLAIGDQLPTSHGDSSQGTSG